MKYPLARTSRPPMLQGSIICVDSDASCDSAARGRSVKLLVTQKADTKFLPINDPFWVIPFHRDVWKGDNDRMEKAQFIILRMADQLSYLGICVDRRPNESF